MQLDQVVLIGAGNVAWNLGKNLAAQGTKVAQVFSRDLKNARALADTLSCPATDKLQELLPLDDCLYLIAVKDDQIANVAAAVSYLSHPRRALAHTSGAVSSQVLAAHSENYGVFYPLQSLSRERIIDFVGVPLCIYAPQAALQDELAQLAKKISEQVNIVNDEERKVLHVAAVFVNNFANHLFAVGKQIVESADLSFDLLRPLIAETAAKVMTKSPDDMQTGPASRGDQQTMLAHLRYLQQFPEFQNLYRVISHSLREMYK